LCNLGVATLEHSEAGHALELHKESLRLTKRCKTRQGKPSP
jgi:hypothetical protein